MTTPFVALSAGENKAAAMEHCVFHVAANQSTDSLWVKLTRLTVDEP